MSKLIYSLFEYNALKYPNSKFIKYVKLSDFEEYSLDYITEWSYGDVLESILHASECNLLKVYILSLFLFLFIHLF